MIEKKISFNVPHFGSEEIKNIKKLLSLKHFSDDGYFTKNAPNG